MTKAIDMGKSFLLFVFVKKHALIYHNSTTKIMTPPSELFFMLKETRKRV